MLGDKAIDCLRFASLPIGSKEREAVYNAACAKWSEKAFLTKMLELSNRGYVEYGVSLRTAWVEPKGSAALLESYGRDVA